MSRACVDKHLPVHVTNPQSRTSGRQIGHIVDDRRCVLGAFQFADSFEPTWLCSIENQTISGDEEFYSGLCFDTLLADSLGVEVH